LWFEQDWDHDPVTLRLYKIKSDVVAEVKASHNSSSSHEKWKFFFIGRVVGMKTATIGLHIASPVAKAGIVKFSYISVSKCPTSSPCFHHNADELGKKDEL